MCRSKLPRKGAAPSGLPGECASAVEEDSDSDADGEEDDDPLPFGHQMAMRHHSLSSETQFTSVRLSSQFRLSSRDGEVRPALRHSTYPPAGLGRHGHETGEAQVSTHHGGDVDGRNDALDSQGRGYPLPQEEDGEEDSGSEGLAFGHRRALTRREQQAAELQAGQAAPKSEAGEGGRFRQLLRRHTSWLQPNRPS